MKLIPYYGDKELTVSDIVVQVSQEDRKRVTDLVKRTAAITQVTDKSEFTNARNAAGELKSLIAEITASKRSAKRPFEAVLNSVEELSKQVLEPVGDEQKRVLDLIAGYVRLLEEEAKEAERKRKEALEAQQRKHDEEMRKMRLQMEQASRDEAAKIAQGIERSEMLANLELELAAMNQGPAKGLVPQGSVRHPFKFRLVDAEKTVKNGCISLLRIELNLLNCQDAVKRLLEIDPKCTPQLPGIEVTQEIQVSVRATSQIR
jgi:hypothetical protein